MLLKSQLEPMDGPLELIVTFFMPIPKSTKQSPFSPCFKKPDLDNLLKFILDALTGIAFHGDQQVVSIFAKKLYSDEPRTTILLMDYAYGPIEKIKSECI